MARVPDLEPDDLSARQMQVHDEIADSRGGVVRGPFAIWLRDAELADAANRFGGRLRLSGTLEPRLFELMVLVIARYWAAQYEWFAHEQAALDAGVDPAVVEAVRHGVAPEFTDAGEEIVHAAVSELQESRDLSEETYQRVLDRLGLDRAIELVTATGFYTMVAMMLKAFDAPVPGDARPLPELEARHA